MSDRNRFPLLLTLGVAVMLSAAGCSTLPNQPTAPVAPESAASFSEATSSEVLGLDALGGTSTLSTTTRKLVGPLGGIVSAGNFTLVFPVGALTTTATVTVSQPDPTKPVVNLSISPASANKFLLPVLMIANASPMNRSLLSTAYISYYNPTTARWERVSGSSVNVLSLTVSAPLWHFSTYRVESGGKAGW